MFAVIIIFLEEIIKTDLNPLETKRFNIFAMLVLNLHDLLFHPSFFPSILLSFFLKQFTRN